jgi:glycosyltransferase involved in cell wall biosynthesis
MKPARPREQIRICHVQLLPLLTGVQRVMLEIFKQLNPDRFELHVACRETGPLTDELDSLGIEHHSIPSLQRSIRPFSDWRALGQLRELFTRCRFDVVHTHSSKPGILGRLAARQAGVPAIVHHVHGFSFHEFSSWPSWWLGSRAEKWAGTHCDRVIFVNQEERKLSIDRGWLPAEKCLTVYNGVDLEAFAPGLRRYARNHFQQQCGLENDEVAILMLGRLDRQKQPLILPRIAARLQSLLPTTKWRILVAGAGPLQQALTRDIKRLGLASRITLLDWQADPQQTIQAADIVLHPTLWEGLPLALIEAQAVALPTVASDVKGNREVVTEETGILCPPRNADAFAMALARLMQSPNLRTALGQAGRRRAETHFNAGVNYRHVASLYEQLAGRPRDSADQRRAA